MSESASKRRVVLISAALVASLIANAVLAWVVVRAIRLHEVQTATLVGSLDASLILEAVALHLRPGMPREEIVAMLERELGPAVRVTVLTRRVVANDVVFELDGYGGLYAVSARFGP